MPFLPKPKHLIDLQPSRNLMRNKQHRHLSLELVDGFGEVLRRLGIEVRHRFIEDQYLRFLEQCPGNRNALLLATR